MDVIEGSELQVADAVYAYQLDGKGGVTPIERDDKITCDAPCWLHLDYAHPASAEWLSTTPLLPDSVREALSGESSRPRVSRQGEGTMITLRSINFNANSRPDQLVTIRVYITD
ncbi:CorA family divalent cation transporter, partial [Escherichia coli]